MLIFFLGLKEPFRVARKMDFGLIVRDLNCFNWLMEMGLDFCVFIEKGGSALFRCIKDFIYISGDVIFGFRI